MPRGKQPDAIVIEPDNGNAKPNSIADIAASLNATDTDTRDASGTIIIDPAAIVGPGSGSDDATAGQPEKKRRGRKPGSTNKSSGSKAQSSLDVNGVEALLFSMHNLLATVSNTQELALDKTESKMLAEGVANVARHYDLGATQKSIDWANLIQCVGLIYGTRIYAIRSRVQKERRDAAAASSMTSVHHVPGAA